MPKDKETKEEIKEKKSKEEKKIKELEEQLAKAKADVEHWKNEYYRAYADTKNLRTSLEKDHSEAIKYRAIGFIEELLPVLDSFHMALANEPTSQELKNYLVGFQFVYRNLISVLENEGVRGPAVIAGRTFLPFHGRRARNGCQCCKHQPGGKESLHGRYGV